MALPVHARSRNRSGPAAHPSPGQPVAASDCPVELADLLSEAMNNMPHGVVMFDAAARIVVSNRRYIEMYGLSEAVVRPGCTLHALIEHRKQTGLLSRDVEVPTTGDFHLEALTPAGAAPEPAGKRAARRAKG